MANNFEIIVSPEGFVLPASAHPDRGVVQGRSYLAFDVSTVETARSKAFRMPAAYTGSGTLKAAIQYAMASATSGKVDFEVAVEALTPADAVDTDAAESFDTANAGNQTVPGTAGYLGELIITLTNKDSVAAGDYVRITIERDADDGTDDTASGDARVYSVTIYEEV
jgi:hypothetical protein